MDELGQLAYSVWYYPSLAHDEDQRDNEIGARRQRVQILMARWQQATSWFNPELLTLPLERVREWMAGSAGLAVYRFAIENLYRLQEHVLDDKGEQLMSLVSRFDSAPSDAYEALSTADAKFPTITLSDGRQVTVSYGEFRSILATARQQSDREAAFKAYLGTFETARNTYASLYNSVCQRDWFVAQARGYGSTLDAALHVHNIPPSVVENLIAVTRAHASSLAALSPAAQARPGPRPLLRLRHPGADRGRGAGLRLRRGPGVGRGVGRPAGRRRTASASAGVSGAAASTCTRTTASGAAPTPRRCTACTRTCC